MIRLTTFLKLMALLTLSVALIRYGPPLAFAVLDGPDSSPARRAGAVAIIVITFLPWLAVAGWAISRADEYARHIFLLGIALAMAGSMLVFVAFDFMRDTHMLGESMPIPWFPVMIAMWAVGTAAASGYYRLRR
jgi:hypothetical protein